MITSKYYNKTHQEIIYNLEEHQCPYCNHWFMIDTDFVNPRPLLTMTIIIKSSALIAGSHIESPSKTGRPG